MILCLLIIFQIAKILLMLNLLNGFLILQVKNVKFAQINLLYSKENIIVGLAESWFALTVHHIRIVLQDTLIKK